jgi:hypothetical protein
MVGQEVSGMEHGDSAGQQAVHPQGERPEGAHPETAREGVLPETDRLIRRDLLLLRLQTARRRRPGAPPMIAQRTSRETSSTR